MFSRRKSNFFKIYIIPLVIILFSYGIQASPITIKEKKWLNTSCEDKNKILSKHLLSYLRPTINNCLATYYGEQKQSFTRIIYVAPYLPDDEIQVEAQTFTGPHNPPYGKDILTFSITADGNIRLINYQHTDIDTLDIDS